MSQWMALHPLVCQDKNVNYSALPIKMKNLTMSVLAQRPSMDTEQPLKKGKTPGQATIFQNESALAYWHKTYFNKKKC